MTAEVHHLHKNLQTRFNAAEREVMSMEMDIADMMTNSAKQFVAMGDAFQKLERDQYAHKCYTMSQFSTDIAKAMYDEIGAKLAAKRREIETA